MATLRNDSTRTYLLPKRGEGKSAFGGDGLSIGPGQTLTVPEAYAVELRHTDVDGRHDGLKHLVVSEPVKEKSA